MRCAAMFLMAVLMGWMTLAALPLADAQTVQTTVQAAATTATAKHGENVLDACVHVGKIALITIVVSFAVAFMMKLMAKLLHRQPTQG